MGKDSIAGCLNKPLGRKELDVSVEGGRNHHICIVRYRVRGLAKDLKVAIKSCDKRGGGGRTA